jgi:dTMP kinase
MRGRLITLEGGEGTGKSSQRETVRRLILAAGHDVIVTHEPGGTVVAEQLRRIVLEPSGEPILPLSELLLIFAARLQHVQHTLRPALEAGLWVLCDRFIDSTYAYQRGGRGLPLATIETLERWVLDGLRPDLTVLFDAPVEIALRRVEHRSGILDRIEREDAAWHERVRRAFLQRAQDDPTRFLVVDASVDSDTLVASLSTLLPPRLAALAAENDPASERD